MGIEKGKTGGRWGEGGVRFNEGGQWTTTGYGGGLTGLNNARKRDMWATASSPLNFQRTASPTL